MRIATRVVLVLLVVGLILAGALLLATAAIGPGQSRTPAAGAASRPAEDNWRTDNSVLEGVPVALLLIVEFAGAWVGMASLPPLAVTATVGVLAVDGYLLIRFLRRRGHVSLPV